MKQNDPNVFGSFCLNTDYNWDTTAKSVQKAVRTKTLNFYNLLIISARCA